jgi:hypothetical protein
VKEGEKVKGGISVCGEKKGKVHRKQRGRLAASATVGSTGAAVGCTGFGTGSCCIDASFASIVAGFASAGFGFVSVSFCAAVGLAATARFGLGGIKGKEADSKERSKNKHNKSFHGVTPVFLSASMTPPHPWLRFSLFRTGLIDEWYA